MRYKILLRIGISLIFLSYLIFEINWSALIDTFHSIRVDFFFISLLVALLNSFVLAQKYRVLMRPTGLYQPFLRLVKINFVSRFYAVFLSTAVGHGIIRWYKVTKDQDRRSRFLSVMVLERLTFLVAILCAAIVSITVLSNPRLRVVESHILPFLWVGLSLSVSFLFCFHDALFYRLMNRGVLWVTKKLSVLLQRPFGPFDFSVTYSYQQILLALFFALLWHMFFLIRVYSLFLSLRIPLSFLHVTWMASLVLFVQVIPVSFSGIGVRETAYAYLFKIQNLPPENGALIGILLFSQILFMSCIGALLELSSKD